MPSRGTSLVNWVRDKNPFKRDHGPAPPPPMPFLPEQRPRALTPPPSSPGSGSHSGPDPEAASSQTEPTTGQRRTGSKDSFFFQRLPPEIRHRIIDLAFGEQVLHVDLDYTHPMIPPSDGVLPENNHTPATKRHAGRNAFYVKKPGVGEWRGWRLHVDETTPKTWQWWSCVCHRLLLPFRGHNHWACASFAGFSPHPPIIDQCKYGANEMCEQLPPRCVEKCHIGVMGWLLSCHQAYVETIGVLYSTNVFHLSNTELILNLPRLLLPSRVGSIVSLEMIWKIHPFRERTDLDPAHGDYGSFLKLVQKTPNMFPRLRNLYIALQGDTRSVGTDERALEFLDESRYNALMKPVEAMICKFNHLKICAIAVPSSVYGYRLQLAVDNGDRICGGSTASSEMWCELQGAASVYKGTNGYWLQAGHRDLAKGTVCCFMGHNPFDDPFGALYSQSGVYSPW